MSTITTWHPFREFDALTQRLLGLAPVGKCETASQKPWAPSVDITETDAAYTVTADLPEVPKDAVKVTVEEGVLTVRGERKWEKKTDDTKVHLVERSYGSFARSFRLPEDAAPDKVEATYKDGVLTVVLPKVEQKKPAQIEVKIV